MHLHASLGAAKTRPREQRQAERDNGGIKRNKFVFEAKLGFALSHSGAVAQAVEGALEQVLEHLGVTFFCFFYLDTAYLPGLCIILRQAMHGGDLWIPVYLPEHLK